MSTCHQSFSCFRATVNVCHPFCLADERKCVALPHPLPVCLHQSGWQLLAATSHCSFTFDALIARYPGGSRVTWGSAPAGVAWSSHGAFGSRHSRLSGGSLHTRAGFTSGRSRQGLKQCRQLICRRRSERTVRHPIGCWTAGVGGAHLLTAQDVSAEFEQVMVGRRLSLQHNITLVSSAAWGCQVKGCPALVFLLLVFLDIPAVPAVPGARPVLGILVDPPIQHGPRLPSGHQSLGGPRPHLLLSEEAGAT